MARVKAFTLYTKRYEPVIKAVDNLHKFNKGKTKQYRYVYAVENKKSVSVFLDTKRNDKSMYIRDFQN